MVATVQVKYGEKDAGCWFDGHRGIYMGEAIIDCAIAHGAKIDPTPGSHGRWADDEFYMEIWDEADQFMQQFAEDGFWFGYNEGGGDWGLWAGEED